MQQRFRQALKIFFFLTLFLSSSLSLFLIKKLDIRIEKTYTDAHKSTRLIKKNTSLIIHALVAEKVEALTKDKHSEEEKVIAIAEWVSGNIVNRHKCADKFSDPTDFSGESFETYFAFRRGACGARSLIFAEMVKYINIPVNRYSICCFLTREHGHTTVQVYYDKAWHFFDVTYAGYFRKNGKILSFEEIVELAKNKEDHLKYLVVFPSGSDYYTSQTNGLSSIEKVDNTERMQKVYTKNRLTNASNYGAGEDCNRKCPVPQKL